MLYLVPTPIGNLQDITLRALDALRNADLIACEDTRHSGHLLRHYEIQTPTVSYHAHNEHKRAAELVERMASGENIALITDAGSPGISDPGFYLVRACIQAGIEVCALPGATAVIPALTVSGLPCERFVFDGFLPTKKGRKTRLEQLVLEPRTMVLFEAPHRIVRTLVDLANVLGPDRPAAVAREVSKSFEEVVRGTLCELRDAFASRSKVRGELVIVVGGAR